MKYIAILMVGASLYFSYEGWTYNRQKFYMDLQKKFPAFGNDVANFEQENNTFNASITAGGRLTVNFDATPGGIKTVKILADSYRKVSDTTYISK